MQHRVLTNLHHDGEKFSPGDLVELTPGEAAPLIAQRVVELEHLPFSKPATSQAG